MQRKEEEFGLYKFKIPRDSEYLNALGLAGESTLLKKILTNNIDSFYKKIQAPKKGDWLMNHKEFGQTFDEFSRSKPKLVSSPKVIYLMSLSYSETTLMNIDFILGLKMIAEAYFFGMKVKLIQKVYDLGKYKIKTKINSESKKIQICANQILSFIYKDIPSNAYCMIAFTDQDLYLEEMEEQEEENTDSQENEEKVDSEEKESISHSFTFGLTYPKLSISIFSFARYDPLFYTNDKTSDSKNENMQKFFTILLKRSCRVLIKEISIMMNLKNCIYYDCAINGFSSMEEFDNKPFEVCPICLRKIYAIICSKKGSIARISNADILFERFVKIKDTLEDHFSGVFDEEIDWYKSRIDYLKDEIVYN